MTTATISDREVLDALATEIDSIKVETGEDSKVEYSPAAWTREGYTD